MALTHEVANDLGTQATEVLGSTGIEQGSYRNVALHRIGFSFS